MNAFDEIRQQLAVAREQLRAADHVAHNMASLLQGRLRSVWDKDLLRMLKRELRDFDAVTGKWRESK